MALRLAGEEFSVVRGLDAQGWPREIEANDADPGLKISQSGSGPALQFQQAAAITTTAGNLTLSPAGNVVLGATVAANGFNIANVNALDGVNMRVIQFYDMIEWSSPTAPSGDRARLYAKDNGAGKTQLIARFPTGAEQVLATEP